MTRLYDDPAAFSDDMLAGFIDVHRRYVRGVPGGVVRSASPVPGKVAVVIGGGAGHYPAFCGVVGDGFADGAVVGNVFTSPSKTQVESVARAASAGGGVVLMSGNYTGDVLNFELARAALVADGIDTAYVTVTDDVASAPPGEEGRRRGVAGGFVVFKIAGAAADQGAPLAEVVRLARRANSMSRTIGVAFAGCTLPGDDKPLFTVPEGRMSVGLGIHGEPGIAEVPVPSAAELACILVERLRQEAPVEGPGKVAAVLNGLGGVKYEELFVVWSAVVARLRASGLEVVDPEVGELVTSLDMAGCSLSLTWLDDELEGWWRSGADAPAFRKAGTSPGGEQLEQVADAVGSPATSSSDLPVAADPHAQAVAGAFGRMMTCLTDLAPELGRLDAVAGDGDHGRGMLAGVRAARSAAQTAAAQGGLAEDTLRTAGEAWAAKAGGTSGVLWGAGLVAASRALGHDLGPEAWVRALRSAHDEIRTLGKATPGDKTMLDALSPFVDALEADLAGGGSWRAAWERAADIAYESALATAVLVPRVGRARPLAARSVGTPDPGAISLAACARAAIPPGGLVIDPAPSSMDGRS